MHPPGRHHGLSLSISISIDLYIHIEIIFSKALVIVFAAVDLLSDAYASIVFILSLSSSLTLSSACLSCRWLSAPPATLQLVSICRRTTPGKKHCQHDSTWVLAWRVRGVPQPEEFAEERKAHLWDIWWILGEDSSTCQQSKTLEIPVPILGRISEKISEKISETSFHVSRLFRNFVANSLSRQIAWVVGLRRLVAVRMGYAIGICERALLISAEHGAKPGKPHCIRGRGGPQ